MINFVKWLSIEKKNVEEFNKLVPSSTGIDIILSLSLLMKVLVNFFSYLFHTSGFSMKISKGLVRTYLSNLLKCKKAIHFYYSLKFILYYSFWFHCYFGKKYIMCSRIFIFRIKDFLFVQKYWDCLNFVCSRFNNKSHSHQNIWTMKFLDIWWKDSEK